MSGVWGVGLNHCGQIGPDFIDEDACSPEGRGCCMDTDESGSAATCKLWKPNTCWRLQQVPAPATRLLAGESSTCQSMGGHRCVLVSCCCPWSSFLFSLSLSTCLLPGPEGWRDRGGRCMGGQKNVRRRRLYCCTRQVGLCQMCAQWCDCCAFGVRFLKCFSAPCGVCIPSTAPTNSCAGVGAPGRWGWGSRGAMAF